MGGYKQKLSQLPDQKGKDEMSAATEMTCQLILVLGENIFGIFFYIDVIWIIQIFQRVYSFICSSQENGTLKFKNNFLYPVTGVSNKALNV